MRIAILSTYPPRRCGLATFTTDLRRAILEADSSVEVLVVPVLDADPPAADGDEVLFTLRQHERADYAEAARRLDASGVDVVLVEHEFGIFGGENGSHLLDLLDHLTVPHVVAAPTVGSRSSGVARQRSRSTVSNAARSTRAATSARCRSSTTKAGQPPSSPARMASRPSRCLRCPLPPSWTGTHRSLVRSCRS